MKLKGINVWPQAVDDLIYGLSGVDEYQVLVESDETESDVATPVSCCAGTFQQREETLSLRSRRRTS